MNPLGPPPPGPELSIVMPTRNQREFIGASIASALAQAQALRGAMEIVVADGASSDGTPEMLAGLQQAHSGVLRWFSEPDRGPADAVNKAVAMARGPVIGWLNSDDLYTPGAAQRACQALADHPEWMMVYGEGEHVDGQGASLGRYPTQRPDWPLAGWADGCPICQPTAFFRRAAFDALGGLDTGLQAAFDYDFWLRLFKHYPDGVGFVDALQAQSRVHAGTITQRQRERVALEGIEVVQRHLGPAPIHWLLTLADELLAGHPFERGPLDVASYLSGLLDRSVPAVDGDFRRALDEALRQHRGLQLAGERFGCNVHADGWAPQVLTLRLLQGAPPVRRLRLSGRHVARPQPGRGRLARLVERAVRPSGTEQGVALDIELPAGRRLQAAVARPGPFSVEIPVDEHRADAPLVFRLTASSAFVPALTEPDSQDRRTLAYQVDQIELLR